MTETLATPAYQWTRERATLLAVGCLLLGIAGGWLIHGGPRATVTASASGAGGTTPASAPASPAPSTEELKQQADAQAAPMLAQLKAHPKDPAVLTALGNLYYDAKQYPEALDYYGRVLQGQPTNVAVRTDRGTALWYMGNADAAIAEFNKALTYEPNNPNTLFNLGLLKSRGNGDNAGAVADWEKLLQANPNYDGKNLVAKMIAEAQGRGTDKP